MAENSGISDIKEGERFILRDGRLIKNLYELLNSLRSMEGQVFDFHVNDSKNDFGNWIRDIIKDPFLADRVFKAKTREDIIHEIGKKLLNKQQPGFIKSEKQMKEAEGPAYAAGTKHPSEGEEIIRRLDEILVKEKELEKREQKIQEIEERIEKKVSEQKEANRKNEKVKEFFSAEFAEGAIIGFLLSLIMCLAYVKFILKVELF